MGAGDTLEVVDPLSGQAVAIRIPSGAQEGQMFKVTEADVVPTAGFAPVVSAAPVYGGSVNMVSTPYVGTQTYTAPAIAAPATTFFDSASAAIVTPSATYGTSMPIVMGGSVNFAPGPSYAAPMATQTYAAPMGGSLSFPAIPQYGGSISAPVQTYAAPMATQTYAAPMAAQTYAAPMATQTYAAPMGGSVQFSAAPQFSVAPQVIPAAPQFSVAPQVMSAAPQYAPALSQTYAAPMATQTYAAPMATQTYAAPMPTQFSVAPQMAPMGGSLQFAVSPQMMPAAPQVFQAAPTAPAEKKEVSRKMKCPPGMRPGDMCQAIDPTTGQPVSVQIPSGVREGDVFKAKVFV